MGFAPASDICYIFVKYSEELIIANIRNKVNKKYRKEFKNLYYFGFC
jgi:hypothetical protein